MQYLFKYISFSIVAVVSATMLFSCGSDFKEVQKINVTSLAPAGIAEDVKLVYTDSAKVKAILTSPLNKDFSNQPFRYSEFPEGVKVEFFDENNNKSVVTADYGILYTQTNLVDLQGNVVLNTHDGNVLKTQQLFWDQGDEWIFTEKKFTFNGPEQQMNAFRLDVNRDFSIISTGPLTDGEVNIDQ
ncbi:LPS export ABC transporter periplasmic protein LptC [Sungkyunkwania multivorans]|uniref:LPS export ABC transporter periplasmic protein LptC n=1 Tax=Sungkyunkwania multivorans TaxID=1173618 RepID=A0ABW3D0U2_9FLAO